MKKLLSFALFVVSSASASQMKDFSISALGEYIIPLINHNDYYNDGFGALVEIEYFLNTNLSLGGSLGYLNLASVKRENWESSYSMIPFHGFAHYYLNTSLGNLYAGGEFGFVSFQGKINSLNRSYLEASLGVLAGFKFSLSPQINSHTQVKINYVNTDLWMSLGTGLEVYFGTSN